MVPARWTISVLALCIAGAATAQEDRDLDLIPRAISDNATPAADASGKVYLVDAATFWSLRNNLAVPRPAPTVDWQNRTSLDGQEEWRLNEALRVTVSDRVSVIEENDVGLPAHQNLRNDFREAYVTWQASADSYVEAGRINVKNGDALGFNPTDFFKTRSGVELASLDPTVLRENRLGTASIRLQRIFDGGSIGFVAAPRLDRESPLPASASSGIDPLFGRTNGENRFLLSGRYDVTDQLSSELLLYHSDSESRVGANLSHGIGKAIIAYGEWSGGRQYSLARQALSFGRATGQIPAATLDFADEGAKSFSNQLTVGASWSGETDVMVNLEYHYNQAGFSRQQWRNWFSLGQKLAQNPLATEELWYLRAYAADQQEPMTRQEIFAHAAWSNAFIRDLELSALAFVDPYDGSSLAQFAVSYYASDAWTVEMLTSANAGSPRSDHGSVKQAGGAILQVIRYF